MEVRVGRKSPFRIARFGSEGTEKGMFEEIGELLRRRDEFCSVEE